MAAFYRIPLVAASEELKYSPYDVLFRAIDPILHWKVPQGGGGGGGGGWPSIFSKRFINSSSKAFDFSLDTSVTGNTYTDFGFINLVDPGRNSHNFFCF